MTDNLQRLTLHNIFFMGFRSDEIIRQLAMLYLTHGCVMLSLLIHPLLCLFDLVEN